MIDFFITVNLGDSCTLYYKYGIQLGATGLEPQDFCSLLGAGDFSFSGSRAFELKAGGPIWLHQAVSHIYVDNVAITKIDSDKKINYCIVIGIFNILIEYIEYGM